MLPNRINTRRWLPATAVTVAVTLIFCSMGIAQTQPSDTDTLERVPASSEQTSDTLTNSNQQTGQETSNAEQRRTSEASVLDRGPIHEAFAEPLSQTNAKPIVVDRQPPESIEEIPPKYRPAGENVEWIPGYWFWLVDRDDFVWVSGVWRTVPPGRQWTPGHWAKDPQGYRWVSGFWSDVEVEQVEYLPYPPQSLEQGPSSPAPGDSHFWIPGCWHWDGNRYAWRPGYWYAGNSAWVWVPHRYVYTPRGALFVRGYWDYPLQRRGLLYAPVYWAGGYPDGYVYSPSRLVNTALLLTALFIDADRGLYYYGAGYGGLGGYYPWYAGYGAGIYSPFYSYYASRFGHNSDRWRDRFDGGRQRRGRELSLVGTLNEVRQMAQRDVVPQDDGGTLDQIVEMTARDQEAVRERVRNMRRFRAARATFENAASGDVLHARTQQQQSDGNPASGKGARQATATVLDNDRPPVFDLRTADGAKQLRQRGQMRNGRLSLKEGEEIQRRGAAAQNRRIQNSGDHLHSRDRASKTQIQRPGTDTVDTKKRDRALSPREIRDNRQPPLSPRRPQLEPRGKAQPKGVRPQQPPTVRPQKAKPPQVNRSRGNELRSNAPRKAVKGPPAGPSDSKRGSPGRAANPKKGKGKGKAG